MSLWEKMKVFPHSFDDITPGNIEQFYNMLMSPTNIFYEIGDEVGLGIATQVRARLDAVVHVLLFDRRLKGREPMLKEMLRDLMRRARLRRITAAPSSDNPMAVKLVQRLGFRLEGTLRQSVLRGGEYHDMLIYGMLREELMEGA